MDLQNLKIVEDQEDIVAELLEQVHKLGYMSGYRDGYEDGAEDTENSYKPLASDALRAGLTSGGTEMQKFKK